MNTLKLYADRVNQRLEEIPAVIEDGRCEIGSMPWLLMALCFSWNTASRLRRTG